MRRNKDIELAAPFPIVARDLHVRLGNNDALRGADLTIEPGEVVALIGSNGSGKSTFLNTISGLYEGGDAPRHGSVHYGDVSIYDTLSSRQRGKIRARHFGMAQQDPSRSLLPTETVETNMRFPANRRGQRIDEDILESVVGYYGLDLIMHQQAGDLSGGQQQILAVARTEITDPDVFLLDEPMAALDPEKRALVNNRMLYLAGEAGKTVIMVSHEDRPVAPRIVQFELGRVIADSALEASM